MKHTPDTYRIASVHLENDTLVNTPPTAPETTQSRIAVVFHVFYIDLFEEACRYLETITQPYDLYVTVPENMPEDAIRKIFALQPDARVYRCENRGRDVLPFLQVMRLIGTSRYDYICKLHTKKTGGSALGEVWRKLLYFDLIGSDETVRRIVSMFDEHPDICMITGKNTILDSRRYDYGNTAKIDRLVDDAGLLFQDEYTFAGGTMFWARSELFAPVLELFEKGKLPFEEEKGQKDNTIAHALERFFGILCKTRNQRIAPSPTRYSRLDDDTLDQVASLVLSQQYHGEDVYRLQNEAIRNLYRRVDELEELADLKRRLKKTVRGYMPHTLWDILKNGKRIVLTLKNNPALFSKAWYYLKRGEVGHLLRKIKEKSEGNLKRNEGLRAVLPQRIFKRFAKSDYDLGSETVIDIVIPVYNGFEFLPKLFESIEKHTTTPYRLIVVDDASSDERVLPYLKKRLADFENAVLIKHENNLGFVKSVNEAVEHTKNHFVILNTDTEVPAFWLERLMHPIVHDADRIASTTPFTNAGTIASFPEFLADNPIFEGMDVERLDRVFRNVDPGDFYEPVPTGVGFCMGVNRTLVDKIGFFDEEAFGKGYGEENDWCQRAIEAGYTNLLVPNLFVYHKHGGSFSAEEKAKLLKTNALKLLEKHPTYDRQVQEYIARDPHATLRELLTLVAASKASGIHLVIEHALGGGAQMYADDFVRDLQQRHRPVLRVAYDFYTGAFTFRFFYKDYAYGFLTETFDGLSALLAQLDIEEIFLNSLVSYKEPERMLSLLRDLKEIHGASLTIPVHDFHIVCPNFTLLDETGHFCGVPDDFERCNRCMASNRLEWRSFGEPTLSVEEWRRQWQTLLEEADRILCFSESSANIVKKAYPSLNETNIEIRPHSVPPLPKIHTPASRPHSPLRIGILGAINHAKGAGVVKELVERADKENLPVEIVLIGEISEPVRSDRFKMTGRYERDRLPQIVREEMIDIFLIPSICPETFSYTTEEIMMMGYPLMVFNIGAPAERVGRYEHGTVLPSADVDAIVDFLEKRYGLDEKV
jgi:GT2 family glycosyltransferase